MLAEENTQWGNKSPLTLGGSPVTFCLMVDNADDALATAPLAPEMGYADQAHMIREFKAHSGFTPTQYRALTRDRLTHVPHPEHDQMCPAPDDPGGIGTAAA